MFSQFDVDDDGKLDESEFTKLCKEQGPGLSEAEIAAGLELLDTDGSGSIEFGEWVTWWVKGTPAAKRQEQLVH